MLKKFFNKQTVIAFMLGAFLFSGVPVMATVAEYIFTPSSTKLIIDNVEYSNPDIPINLFLYQDRNYIPIAVFKELCIKVGIPFEYDNITKEIKITTTGVTINTTGKEEMLMSTTDTITTDKITYSRDTEDNKLIIITQNGVSYITIADIESNIFSKYKDVDNVYLFKYDEITNTSYIEHTILNLKMTEEEYKNRYAINFQSYKTEIIAKDIPCYTIKNDMITIKYEDYLNKVKPLFNKESSN